MLKILYDKVVFSLFKFEKEIKNRKIFAYHVVYLYFSKIEIYVFDE